MLAGSGLFARGVYALGGVTSDSEARLERFNRSRAQGKLNEVELARFEGQLELEASGGARSPRWSAVGSIGGAAAGAGLIALGATSRLRGPARDVMYYEGGALFVVETALAVWQLSRESVYEREWRAYRADNPEQTSALHVRFAPLLAPHVAALSVLGQF